MAAAHCRKDIATIRHMGCSGLWQGVPSLPFREDPVTEERGNKVVGLRLLELRLIRVGRGASYHSPRSGEGGEERAGWGSSGWGLLFP